jgi:hypothetical protein
VRQPFLIESLMEMLLPILSVLMMEMIFFLYMIFQLLSISLYLVVMYVLDQAEVVD